MGSVVPQLSTRTSRLLQRIRRHFRLKVVMPSKRRRILAGRYREENQRCARVRVRVGFRKRTPLEELELLCVSVDLLLAGAPCEPPTQNAVPVVMFF